MQARDRISGRDKYHVRLSLPEYRESIAGTRRDQFPVLVRPAESTAAPLDRVAEGLGAMEFSFRNEEPFGVGEILECILARDGSLVWAKVEVCSLDGDSQNGFGVRCRILESRSAQRGGLPGWAADWAVAGVQASIR